jgi:hypothetical protein
VDNWFDGAAAATFDIVARAAAVALCPAQQPRAVIHQKMHPFDGKNACGQGNQQPDKAEQGEPDD